MNEIESIEKILFNNHEIYLKKIEKKLEKKLKKLYGIDVKFMEIEYAK